MRIERDGLLRSETQPGISTPRTYSYTALGEVVIVNDPVTGSVTNSYDAATRRLLSVSDPLGRETTYDYHPGGSTGAGQIKGVRDAANNWTYFEYNLQGQLYRQWGVNTYPVEHQYDEAGRMISLKTFRTLPGAVNWASATWPNPPGGDVTQWVYDSPSGLLERKIYADAGAGAKTIIYAYDAGHFLDTKLNGRGQASDYTIDAAGRLRTVTYSDGAPSATLDYDRAGRLRSITDGSGTRTLAWNDRSQPLNESYTSGMLAGMSVNRTYDSQFRFGRLELKQSGVKGSIPQIRMFLR
jgi:YD repeat-containing protein